MSNEVEFNSLTKDDVKIRFEDPSGIPSKPTDEEVAKHRRTRLILVVLFAVAVVAMVVVAVIIIIVAPRCEKAEEVPGQRKGNDTVDENWWKNAVIYQVYPLSFKDSDGDDGYGDLKGIAEKMDYFTELGVHALGLSPIYESPMDDAGYDISNYTVIDKKFGTMEEFEDFLKGAHEKGFKIIMEFVPNHSSNKHPWFEASKKSKDNEFREYYIWRDGAGAGKDQPPNNWISVFGGSAWTYDDTTKQYYLHQFHKEQPDLNLRNAKVKEELKKVLRFWLDKGVDGFRVNAAQFLLEADSFKNETERSNNYNASDLTYDMLDHTLTYDLDGNRDILSEFQKVLDEYNSHPILVADVQGSYAKTSKYYEMTDIPINFGLINKVDRQGMTLAQGINATVKEYLASVPEGKTPNWVIGDHNNARVGSRLGEDNRYAMNTLALTLPGVAMTYYGEEIGMLDVNVVNSTDYRDKERTPMQWNKEAHAGFSKDEPWLPVASDYLTINVDTEKGDSDSYLNKYKELIKLRNNTAFVSGEFNVVHVDTQVFSYVRSHEDDYFLVVINFSNKIWDGDLEKLSGLGTVVYDTQSKLASKEKVDVNKLKLNVGQAVVVKKGDDKWHMA